MANLTEYLSDDGSRKPAPVATSNPHQRPTPPRETNTDVKPRASESSRVTLKPRITMDVYEEASVFHRALALFNQQNDSDLTWDDLTLIDQGYVRELARQIDAEDHPCR